jgi:hypothetical protein
MHRDITYEHKKVGSLTKVNKRTTIGKAEDLMLITNLTHTMHFYNKNLYLRMRGLEPG